jgi:1,5-anhydro-D-fructose reductase (1,5-anhydro-D-mannitol-forming)
MAKKMIHWGMIGTGNVTRIKSAPAFNKIENSQLVAVSNRTLHKAEAFASLHNISKVYSDPLDVIGDPQVDAVYIATPPGSHMEYALATIKAGKTVYIEKPMARTWEECNTINNAAEKAGTKVFVAYYRRSLDYFKKVKSIIDEGTLGRILQINLQQYFPAREEDHFQETLPWRVIPEDAGGGYFHDMGCHALDILFYIFGDPLQVAGNSSNMGGLYAPPDTLSATLILPGDLLLTGSWSFVTPQSFQKDLVEVIGSKGMIKFSIFSFRPITLVTGSQPESISIDQPEHIQMPLIQSIVNELNGSGTSPSTGSTAAVTSRIMDTITGTR